MTSSSLHPDRSLDQAAQAIAEADRLLIAAGAGMGVDSGLPDFRGNEGFWRAYPAFRDRGLAFMDLANPRWFRHDPRQAWGFYGHRLNLYRKTDPHAGFAELLELGARTQGGCFVFTSNVDGQFQIAGYDEQRIAECHGSIHHLQCAAGCHREVWSAADVEVEIDDQACRAIGELPTCQSCGGVARPNILMFGDRQWVDRRTAAQESRFEAWLNDAGDPRRLVTIEVGAGLAVPTVRVTAERLPGTLVRINPREPEVPASGFSIPLGAMEAIRQIRNRLEC